VSTGILFPNVRPKASALALIQRDRHPRVLRYAEAAMRSKLGVSEHRENLWIEGYQRFGDEFEATFAALKGNFNTIKRPARMHNELEGKLADPWMLVGRRLEELPQSVQDAWHLFRSREDVVRVWINDPKPPVDLADIFSWAVGDGYFDWENLGKTWTDRITTKFRWTLPELREVMAYGLTHEEVDEYRRRGLKTAKQFAAHFRDGIPIEYIVVI
jgi:hypothetical protein